MSPSIPRIAMALLAVGLLALPVAAQCPPIGDDGFASVGCCVPVTPTIPNFGSLGTTGNYGAFDMCNPTAYLDYDAKIRYFQTGCDEAIISFEAFPGAPVGQVYGRLYAKYSRTFILNSGGPTQVWRFIVNGDLYFPDADPGAAPIEVPQEGVMGNPVHFFGSIDYRCDSTSPSGFTVRYDLTHLPECVSHAPWSTRPLPPSGMSNSYHFVGPTGFTYGGTAATSPGGPSFAEALRSSVPGTCMGEQQVMDVHLNSMVQGCLDCSGPLGGTPGNYEEQHLEGNAFCGGGISTFQSMPIPGITGNGLLTLALGFYADGTELTVYFGQMDYSDMCNGLGPMHYVAGSGTRSPFGYQSFTAGPFGFAMDLVNSETAGFGTVGWGSPFKSSLVWNFNW